MDPTGISDQQQAAFTRDGFLHVPGVIGERELIAVREASERIMHPTPPEQARGPDYTYHGDAEVGEVLQRINHLQEKHEAMLTLWAHPRLLAIASALLGRDVLPVAMAMVVKAPGCGVAVPWHRDPACCRVRWGINLGIYLDDADAENGMLHVVPGSHRRRMYDVPAMISRHGFMIPGARPVPVRAGDLIVHNENVLHGSQQVRSRRQRRVIYVGVRTIAEQLTGRGLEVGWVRGVAGLLQHAIARRQAAVIGAGETPFRWDPGREDCHPDPRQGPVSLRIEGHDAAAPEHQILPFEDETAVAASSA